jgi:hypothetical protein
MEYQCGFCNRTFGSEGALEQHTRDSPAHRQSFFECEACDRSFGSEYSLEQHLRDSPAHAPSFDCEVCNRSFSSEYSLEQHLRDSPAHAPSFDCEVCDRSFGSEYSLEQHLRDSPAHGPSFECKACNRSFGSDGALGQHLRDSPAHSSIFECEACDRSFGSQDALEQHLNASCNDVPDLKTPLDRFFSSFPTFSYDSSLPPATSYANLQAHEGWRRNPAGSQEAWNGYQDALNREFQMWYGAEDDLTAWHTLCRAIGIVPAPASCEECVKAVRKTHVNIVDLIDWNRSGDNERVRVFRNVADLREYTKDTGKVFHNTLNKVGGNVILRHLLREIFRGKL